jgi:cytochrome P450
MGHGIFNVDGDAWKFHRKIASHVFTSRNIKNDMTSVFVKNARLVVDKLNEHADTGKQFDMQDLYFRYTLESFAEIAFGERPGLLGDNDAYSAKWARSYDIIQAISARRFLSAAW